MDPPSQVTLTIHAPAIILPDLIEGLAFRGGWKPSETDPTKPKPLTASTGAHRQHPTYKRVEEPILDPQGRPQGTRIIETWEPSQNELAMEVSITLLLTTAQRGKLEKLQELTAEVQKQILDQGLVKISIG